MAEGGKECVGTEGSREREGGKKAGPAHQVQVSPLGARQDEAVGDRPASQAGQPKDLRLRSRNLHA